MAETIPRRVRKILVVDDDPATLRVVRDWFRGKPYEILGAPGGREGLRLAPVRQPDVILLDLKMPDIDGITVARQLKQDPATQRIPILLLTACRDVDAKVQAFEAGADDYVTKPFECEEIEARIESALRKHRELIDALELAHIDEMTRLANFRGFREKLAAEWERAARYSTALSLVFFDLDHFKRLNDARGHQAGDRVLRDIGVLITGGARSNDVAARYGGEEFALILPHTDGGMAVRVAERIRSAVRDFVFLEDETPWRITVSAGVATYPDTPGIDSVDALVRAADVALYRAKDAGRDRVVQSHQDATERGLA
jgi:two-component system cell cycle response regulator